MRDVLEQIYSWTTNNEDLIVWVTVGSTIGFALSLILIPWVIVRLSSDYFSNPDRDNANWLGNHPVATIIFNSIRNLVGFCLLIVGILLLALPGQGLLTIVLGLAIAKFPGKRKLIRSLVEKRQVQRSLNWLRRKANQKEFDFS